MDWQGQKLAEQIMLYSVIIAAFVSFVSGYAAGSVQLMFVVYGIMILLITLIVVPDWPFYNRNPLKWLDLSVDDIKDLSKSQIDSKKTAKSSKK